MRQRSDCSNEGVGLCIPDYVDAFFPDIGVASLGRLACSVEYPLDQTCGGAPTANSGSQIDASRGRGTLARLHLPIVRDAI